MSTCSRAASSSDLLYKRRHRRTTTVKLLPLNDTPFYKKQNRIALRNCGVINPENIDEYIACDGYQALGKVLTEMTPERGHRRPSRTPVCAAAAAQASPPA